MVTFKPALWYPITVVLTAANVVAIGFAAGSAEPLHAVGHGALAVAFGLWAQRLRQPPRGTELSAADPRLEVLETEVSDLRRQLSQTQEGLDFAERLIAQRQEPQRVVAQQRGLAERAAVSAPEAPSKMSPANPPHDLADE